MCFNARREGNHLRIPTTEEVQAKLPNSRLGVSSHNLCSEVMEILPIRGTVQDFYGPKEFEVHILLERVKYDTKKMDGVPERL